MTANEMTDNEIIKFIEHAINSAKGEDGFKEIYWEKLDYILDLVNRQKAEIERLNIESETLVTQLKGAYEQIHKLNMAKSEAIKEFKDK